MLPELSSSQQPHIHTFPCLLSRNMPRLRTSAFVWSFLCQEHLELRQGKGHLQVTATPLVPVVQLGTALKRQNCPCTYSTTTTKWTAGTTSGPVSAPPKLYLGSLCLSTSDDAVYAPFLLLRLINTKRSLSSAKPCPRHTHDYKRSACTSQEWRMAFLPLSSPVQCQCSEKLIYGVRTNFRRFG